jgi:hypothetical protein
MRARERRAQEWAAFRRQRDFEEQQRRDQVLAEFGGDPQALAEEILRLRHGLSLLAKGIDWMKKSAPFAMIPPGPLWKPKSDGADD